MNTTTTDRIEKKTLLRAPQARVWRAVSDATEFGAWFQVKIEGQFAPGAHLDGQMTMPGHEHNHWEIVVDRIEPESLFSFYWHPGGEEEGYNYAVEQSTLVEFRLEQADGGTMLTLVESGFDGLPLERRARAFAGNSEGWEFQLKALVAYVTR